MVKSLLHKRSISSALALGRKAGVPNLIFMTDSERVPDIVSACSRLPAGSIIICRDYHHVDRRGFAAELRAITRENNQFLMVAGDIELAHYVGADGYHMPEYQLKKPPNLADLGLVSAACHTRQSLKKAERLAVDFALMSPVFPTASHPGIQHIGVHRLKRIIEGVKVPVVALGGVNRNTVGALKGLPLIGIAAIDAFSRE
ncbi:thiamine phosphate synthase [Kordiimonas sp. SCSIO 12603]|uniref:thiamine phosphate synthase n=1 Tax=Kordiimonas sp. SCSIO 12603 TaxID=2829596 RepID=UPI002102F52E|nr:thiamine phosphate synthase [Kordiimonas sp. SCSIO 12603]UTW59072.1 thiamine phosphate synthase [Kordiimonas sp. SCSIO 12603]